MLKKGTLLVITAHESDSPHGRHHFKVGETVKILSTAGEAGVYPDVGYCVQSVDDGGHKYRQYITDNEYVVKPTLLPEQSKLLIEAKFRTRNGTAVQLKRSHCRHYMVKAGNKPWTRIPLAEARTMLGQMI